MMLGGIMHIRQQPADKRGFTIVEVSVVVVVFFFIITALAPFVRMARARSTRFGCADNLRELSLGLHAYAADHNDAFPASLGELYPNYVASRMAFDCPAARGTGAPERPDYVYRAGLMEYSSPRETIVSDAEGNHGRSGKNIVRLDGSMDWVR